MCHRYSTPIIYCKFIEYIIVSMLVFSPEVLYLVQSFDIHDLSPILLICASNNLYSFEYVS